MKNYEIEKEIQTVNNTHGVWARRIHKVRQMEDGTTLLQRGFAVTDAMRRETVQYMYGEHMTPATAWRRCKRWLAGGEC